jgi:hypothetical protein
MQVSELIFVCFECVLLVNVFIVLEKSADALSSRQLSLEFFLSGRIGVMIFK